MKAAQSGGGAESEINSVATHLDASRRSSLHRNVFFLHFSENFFRWLSRFYLHLPKKWKLFILLSLAFYFMIYATYLGRPIAL